MTEPDHGTSGGIELTDELIERLAGEAEEGYDINQLRPRGFTCPRCHRTSYNPNDLKEGYCGACHDWTRADDAG